MATKSKIQNISANASIVARGREVVQIEADALYSLSETLDDNFVAACDLIFRSTHRVVVTGMGKSGHIARKIAATLSSTGTPAIFIHPAEAAHGDLGMLIKHDTLLVISNSGMTAELRPILIYARHLGVPVIGIASSPTSLVMEYADVRLALPAAREACTANVAPTTSTSMQLALGDALAMAVMDMRGISSEDLHSLHPGGSIGLKLSPLRAIMHGEDRMPMVSTDASMPEAILKMTSGGFGIVGVADAEGGLIGVITDGDLRRHFSELETASAMDIMTKNPKTLDADMMAQDALLILNNSQITASFVLDGVSGTGTRPIGIVHIHDFLRFGLN